MNNTNRSQCVINNDTKGGQEAGRWRGGVDLVGVLEKSWDEYVKKCGISKNIY